MSTWKSEGAQKARSTRAKYASLTRSRTPDDPELLAAHRDLVTEGLALHIKQVVDQAPILTEEQLDRLSSLLRTAS